MSTNERLLSRGQVRKLNRARTILAELDRAATQRGLGSSGHEALNLGRLAEAAGRAADGLFDVLNCLSSRVGEELTRAELFNEREEES